MIKALVIGLVCGIAGVLIFRQGMTAVMYHHFGLLHAMFSLPDAMRPLHPPYTLLPAPPFGAPRLLYLCFWGGIWGMVLAALIFFVRAPDLLTGALLGGFICTYMGFSMESALGGMPFWSGEYLPEWITVMLVNTAWGWGTAGLLRASGAMSQQG